MNHLMISGRVKNELQIISSEMRENSMQPIERLTISSLKTHNNLLDVCPKSSNSLIELDGGDWHCFAFKYGFGSYSVNGNRRKYLFQKVFKIFDVIFKTWF